jgi:methionyl aminopeptidase
VEESTLKYWKDAGHVARRTLEAMKLELTPGKTFHEVIESAERYIHRHGGKPAFPGTIAVNDLAAHFTTDHNALKLISEFTLKATLLTMH